MKNHPNRVEIIGRGNIQLQTADDMALDQIIARNNLAIESIWEEKQKNKQGALYNDKLLHVIDIKNQGDDILVKGHFVEYKSYLAQRENSKLDFTIKPLGVSGLTRLRENQRDYILFAKRAALVTEYPGCLELVPSGSIDATCVSSEGEVDYIKKLLSEFTEETGFSDSFVEKIAGFAVVLDVDHQVYDVCCDILISGQRDSLLKTFVSSEYSDPQFVAVEDLSQFLSLNEGMLVPTSIALLEVAGYVS